MTLISHYRVVKKLGEGGMGEVYAAVDERLGRKVALKLLPPAAEKSVEWRLRMLREAQAASTLNHPGIVTLHDVGAHEGRLFIVMELVDGESFASLAMRGVKPNEALDLVAQAADALAVAHAAGVLHRDIKSDNLMRTRTGGVKVLDFGLAKLLGEAGDTSSPALIALAHSTPAGGSSKEEQTLKQVKTEEARGPSPMQLTRAGTVMGTPSYMSPEQTKGEAPNQASEVFSLGVVLYELLTSVRPFSRGNVHDTLAAVRKGEFALPSRKAPRRGITRAMDELVARALAKSPVDRFPGMGAFATALREAAQPVARRRVWPFALGLLVAAGAGVTLWAVYPRGEAGKILAGPARRVTFDPGCEEFPSFTPDGRTLVFDALVEGDYEVMAMELEGGARRRLTTNPGWDYAAQVSPDGTKIAYTHQSESNSVRVRPIAGDTEPVVLGQSDSYAFWSRAGEVLFVRGVTLLSWAGSGEPARVVQLPEDRRAVYLAPFPDGKLVAVLGTLDAEIDPGVALIDGAEVRPLPITDAADYPIAASPDGARLYYQRVTATGVELVRRPRDGGPARIVEGGVSPTGGLAISPDGKRLAFSDCKASSYVARIADDGKVVALTRQGGWKDDFPVALGRTHLVVQSDRSGRTQVWRVDLTTGAGEALTPFGTLRPAVSPDGKLLAWAQLDPPGIFVAELGPPLGKPRRLTDRAGDSVPLFSHDGVEVLFTRLSESEPERVYAVPLVAGRGEPRPVTPAGSPIAAVASGAADVFYLAREGGEMTIMVTDLAGRPPERVLGLPAGVYRGLRASADGKRLLAIREDQEILEIDRSATPPLVRSRWRGGVESATAVDYAPDGNGIVATLSVWEGDLWLVEGAF